MMNYNQYKEFLESNFNDDLFLYVVSDTDNVHPVISHPILLVIINIRTKRSFYISFDHQDGISFISLQTIIKDFTEYKKCIYTTDKKSLLQKIPLKCLIKDINLALYLKLKNIINTFKYETNAHFLINKLHGNQKDINKIIPLTKHLEYVTSLYEDNCKVLSSKIFDDFSYNCINSTIIESLSQLERNGLFVKSELFEKRFNKKTINGFVYSQYNIYTSTGRPSNCFDGVNYAALNKNDGSRDCFISRFGKDGRLFLIDYSSFHPRIICKLIDFDLPLDIDIYSYFAELFFNKKNLDLYDINDAKSLTFKQLYGGIEDKYLHINYFFKLKKYIDNMWMEFNKNGFIETPFFRRKITEKHVDDVNPHKLFNYILQATETEIAITTLKKVNEFLNSTLSKPILYTYDSILFDIHVSEIDLVKKIPKLMENNQFPVKCYHGKSYSGMTKINS